jgi:hypothetical protein
MVAACATRLKFAQPIIDWALHYCQLAVIVTGKGAVQILGSVRRQNPTKNLRRILYLLCACFWLAASAIVWRNLTAKAADFMLISP